MTPQSEPSHCSFARRVRLFVRDYLSELGIAWSVARMRDYERNGGHRWGETEDDQLMGLSRVSRVSCDGCGAEWDDLEAATHSDGYSKIGCPNKCGRLTTPVYWPAPDGEGWQRV